MKLKPLPFALAAGIVWGVGIMVITWAAMIFGGTGETITALAVIYKGYDLTFIGSLAGLLWGFIDGFVAGFVLAWLYNLLAKEK